MGEWLILVGAVAAGSVVSLLGGIYLLYGKAGTATLQRIAVPFAAGALLAAAFLDLLPEAIHSDDAERVLMTSLVGLVIFFVLERSLSWFHHHHDEGHDDIRHRRGASLIVIGDTLHNFIDGLAIGAAFLVDPAVGTITTAAIAAHEIPQEIGDFGLLLAKGVSKRNVLLVNLFSALATLIGAVMVYGLGGQIGLSESSLLALTAGFFIYIAASDIIPTIHAEPKRRWANIQTIVLIAGIVIVGLAAHALHDLIPDATEATTSTVESEHNE